MGTATFLSKTSSTIKSVHLSLCWSIAFINRTMQLGGRQLSLVCHAITVQNSRTFCQMEAKRVRKQKMHKIRYGEYYARMQIWTNTKPESNSICKYLSWFVLLCLHLADGWSSQYRVHSWGYKQQLTTQSYLRGNLVTVMEQADKLWALQGLLVHVGLKVEVQSLVPLLAVHVEFHDCFQSWKMNFEP